MNVTSKSPLSRVPLLLCLVLGLGGGACDDDGGVDPVDGGLEDLTPAEQVDDYWGTAPDEETRLELFDQLWEGFGQLYACFDTYQVDWDDSREHYRPLVEQATSHGRLYQVLGEMVNELHDSHTWITSDTVCATPLEERPPRYTIDARVGHMGACVAWTDDSELLVYAVDPETNPLELAPGDVIVGYDGRPWAELIDEIETWALPRCGSGPSSLESADLGRRESVLSNGQLFDTIEVLKSGADTPVSYPTEDMITARSALVCADQLPVEGIEFPWRNWEDWDDNNASESVTWGILEGTDIGYIYVYAWFGEVLNDFDEAVEELMPITEGIIVDQRFNLGGSVALVDSGIPRLFDEDVDHVLYYAERDPSADDYTSLILDPAAGGVLVQLDADEQTFYDHPIAVLQGPKAGSGGDLFPYTMAMHPNVKRFGRATKGAFGALQWFWYPDSLTGDFKVGVTYANGLDDQWTSLQGWEHHPDESVWLTRDDVAAGVDTVVEAALAWIQEENAD